jgi:hypothetical protein
METLNSRKSVAVKEQSIQVHEDERRVEGVVDNQNAGESSNNNGGSSSSSSSSNPTNHSGSSSGSKSVIYIAYNRVR